jgi:hypothetical protein
MNFIPLPQGAPSGGGGGIDGLTSTAEELNALHNQGVTSADLAKLHVSALQPQN